MIAILITIMVLELHTPDGTDWHALRHVLPVLLAYVLSFVYLGIYWNNHHHMLAAVTRVTGASAVGQPAPAVLAVAGPVRHRVDGREPLRAGPDRRLRHRPARAPRSRTTSCRRRCFAPRVRTRCLRAAVGSDVKGKLSPVLYCVGIGLAFVNRWLAIAVYVVRGADVADSRPPRRTSRERGLQADGIGNRLPQGPVAMPRLGTGSSNPTHRVPTVELR